MQMLSRLSEKKNVKKTSWQLIDIDCDFRYGHSYFYSDYYDFRFSAQLRLMKKANISYTTHH